MLDWLAHVLFVYIEQKYFSFDDNMLKVIEVIYENGVFKPLEKVELPEKTRLKIKI